MQTADRRQWIGRQRHVDAILLETGVQLADGELTRAGIDLRLERLAHLICGLADCAALLGRQLGDAAQQVR